MLKKMMLVMAMITNACQANPKDYFGIQVVDEQTGRGVPLVELRTTNEIAYVTDSAGWLAFDELGLMGREVFFHVSSHGYEYPKDMFGFRGLKLMPKAGETTTIKIKRNNIAERLYRVSGGGIYRDSILLGKPVPTRKPILNADLMGNDSVLTAIHQGKIYWFWGDSNRVSYPLGNFRTTSATSELPERGGLKPDVGVDFSYFTGPDGFAKQMVPSEEDGPIWLSGNRRRSRNAGRHRLSDWYCGVKTAEKA